MISKSVVKLFWPLPDLLRSWFTTDQVFLCTYGTWPTPKPVAKGLFETYKLRTLAIISRQLYCIGLASGELEGKHVADDTSFTVLILPL
jgi:hypothetical protein